MSPERRNCLLKKETKTSLYEVAEVFRCLTSFCPRRWSSSLTTRSPAACLKTMSRSFWRIFSELSTKVPNFVYHSNSFFYQMPSLLHAKGPSLCDKDGNSIVHKRVHHLQVFFLIDYSQGHFCLYVFFLADYSQGHFRHISNIDQFSSPVLSSWREWPRSTSTGSIGRGNTKHREKDRKTKLKKIEQIL